MITWIQTVLQKHHKSVFSVLLVVITIAFVFTIGQIPFFGDRHRYEAEKKDFYGFDLSNEGTIGYLSMYAAYDALLAGMRPTDEYLYKQAFLRSVAKELGIKTVGQAELDAYLQGSPVFAGKDGKFDKALFRKFIDERVASGRMTEEVLVNIFSENAMLNKVEKILGGPGYVFKSELQRRYDIANGSWDFNLAAVSYDKFNPEIKIDEAKLEEYYKQSAAAFRVGEGVVLETVFLPAKDFSAGVKEPSEADINAFYASNITKYSEVKDGVPATQPLDSVKARVKADYLKEAAIHNAVAKAEEVGLKIYNTKPKMGSAELKNIFAEAKLQLKKSAPMRSTDKAMPKDLPQNVVSAGFKLDAQNFYSDPIVVDDGVWVVVLAEILPAYQPKLADVRAEVEKAYIAAQKSRLFAEYGAKLDAAFAKGIAEGKKFEAIAKENNVDIDEVKNFSFANPSSSSKVMAAYNVLAAELPKLKTGGVSKMEVFGDNGYIVNLVSFKKPEADAKGLAQQEKNYEGVMASMTARSVLAQAIMKGQKQENK